MHRFAYVGSDLQDMYGVDPRAIGRATNMSDAFFGGGSSARTLAALASTRDGVLVSEETVSDFQLQPGDTLNLRLQSAADHQYHVVPFRFVGVAREFPTAPGDSFLVANADYVAEKTGDAAAEIVLMRALGDPEPIAAAARKAFADAAGIRVTSVGETQRLISSSLTAIDLRGLTTLELTFAVAAVIAAAGLLFGLDVAERRRGSRCWRCSERSATRSPPSCGARLCSLLARALRQEPRLASSSRMFSSGSSRGFDPLRRASACRGRILRRLSFPPSLRSPPSSSSPRECSISDASRL